MKIILQIVLWIAIIFLGWKLYGSITGPIQFNKIKEARYKKVIVNLQDIQAAQLAHQEITGDFTGSFDSLVRFIDTAKFAITQRRDTSYADVEKNKAFGIDEGYYIEEIITDTLGYTSVKDSLYNGTDRYKNMMNIPVEGVDKEIEMQAGKFLKNDVNYSVFEAKVSKKVLLSDLDKDLLAQELQVVSVDGVNGEFIKVGSMDEVNTSGNWPKNLETARDQ
ncbi:hypothetical protein [Marinirhabdus gelatinilytica]|uniref:Uncharacterized protein n=1 Tax=Marinirhabdus gelatinilytica TaxID=1703343 RepID=A0A370QAJ7_9FLAO|nr:hypothetical protein [Marinirhabdus gelatinilytica]RDK85309.1 hypothetical protein C8D94_103132 [Marinirhabdus gelatinilytica]